MSSQLKSMLLTANAKQRVPSPHEKAAIGAHGAPEVVRENTGGTRAPGFGPMPQTRPTTPKGSAAMATVATLTARHLHRAF